MRWAHSRGNDHRQHSSQPELESLEEYEQYDRAIRLSVCPGPLQIGLRQLLTIEPERMMRAAF
jgi:hypothetical protein